MILSFVEYKERIALSLDVFWSSGIGSHNFKMYNHNTVRSKTRYFIALCSYKVCLNFIFNLSCLHAVCVSCSLWAYG